VTKQRIHLKEIDGILCVSKFEDFRTYEPFNKDDKLPEKKQCEHRGPEVGVTLCKVCGENKGKLVPIYSCSIHGKCTTRKYETGNQEEAICMGCPDGPWSFD
jgi:hypothetical protein